MTKKTLEKIDSSEKDDKRKKLPKSIRKYIRLQKALISRQESDFEARKELIKQLYRKFASKNTSGS